MLTRWIGRMEFVVVAVAAGFDRQRGDVGAGLAADSAAQRVDGHDRRGIILAPTINVSQ